MNSEQRQKLGFLYESFYRELLRFAYGKVKSWADAEDLVQRSFEIACRKADTVPEDRIDKAWLTEILFFEIKNHWRAEARREAHTETLDPEKEYIASGADVLLDRLDELRPAELSEEDFQLLKAVSVYGLTYAEAAKAFGLSEAACAKRCQRAKKKIQKFF